MEVSAICSFYYDESYINNYCHKRVVTCHLLTTYDSHHIEEFCHLTNNIIKYSITDHLIQDNQIIPNSKMNIEIEHNDPNIRQVHKGHPSDTQQLINEIKYILNQNKLNQITIIG